MRISEMKQLVKVAYRADKQPMMFWGEPGVGKSQGIAQAADELRVELKDKSFGFIDMRLSHLELTDLHGFPYIVNGTLKFARPTMLPTKGAGILFLDEFVQASQSMMAGASQLILDRRIGEYELPDGWMVAAAGNRKSHHASVNAMPTHIANRFVHGNIEVSVDEWVAWALKAGVDVRIIAFIKWRPVLLHQFDPQAKGEAFASPRSWAFASNLLGAGIPDALLLETMRGTVGEAAAAELIGFLRVYDKMPSIDAILLNPAQAPLVSDPATLYAVTSALVHRAEKDNLARIVTYFNRIKDSGRPDFAVKALKETALTKPTLTNTRAYIEWASEMAPLTA